MASPQSDLPDRAGNRSAAFIRFRKWREVGAFGRIVGALSDEPDLEYVIVDATVSALRGS